MPSIEFPSLRILVVEDNFLVSMLVEDAIRGAGHTLVGIASSAREALEIARSEGAIDLALVDIDLDDGRTGVALAAALSATHGIPSLYATGQGDVARETPDTALGVLDKPFSAVEVVLAVRGAWALHTGERVGATPRNLTLFERPRRRDDEPRETGLGLPT